MSVVNDYHLRVRYAETDAQQVAHHSAYVVWLEAARIDWLRQAGFSYKRLEADGVFMPVTDLHIRYRAPAHFDDELCLQTEALAVGRVAVRFGTRMLRHETLLAEAEVQVACVNADSRLQRLRPELMAVLGASAE